MPEEYSNNAHQSADKTPKFDSDTVKHSAAHVLATAVLRLYPDVKVGVGPVTSEGFYYDFEFPEQIGWKDIKRVEEEMNLIIQEALPFNQMVVPREQAFNILMSRGQIYKAELLQKIPDDNISFYRTGDEFLDLCRGPHIERTDQIGAVKLTALTTQHWQQDESRPELQRISGVAFNTINELTRHLELKKQMDSVDYREIATELGQIVTEGNQIHITPNGRLSMDIIASRILRSFQDQSFERMSEGGLDDINNIGRGMRTYFSIKNRSYKELPVKLMTFARHKLDSSISIQQDKRSNEVDIIHARNYFLPEKARSEIKTSLSELLQVIDSQMNIDLNAKVHTPNLENEALDWITDQIHAAGVSQTVVVDASRTSLSIDLGTTDKFNRRWRLATYRYETSDQQHVSRDGEFRQTEEINIVIILDRIWAYFIEQTNGALPMWLVPTQVIVVPITEQQTQYAKQITNLLTSNNYRVDLDARSETMQTKIRDAEIGKIPVILILGEKESASNSVSLRLRDKQEVGLISQDRLLETLARL